MLAYLFLLSSVLFGFRASYWLPTPLRLEERLAIGVPIGLAVVTLTGFCVSLVVGVNAWMVAIIGAVAGIIGMIGLIDGDRPALLKAEWADFRKRMQKRSFWIAGGVFAVFAALLLVIFSHAVFEQDGTIYAGFGNVWGDWNQHMAQTNSFIHGENIPPHLNTMSGQKLTYPFGTNFLSAMLAVASTPLLLAMKLPVMTLAVSGLALLMIFTRRAAGWAAAAIVPPLFYLLGGLGFINAISDIGKDGNGFFHFLTHQPHNYTQTFGDVAMTNINFINPIYAYVVPQRAFVFGLPLVLTILIVLERALATRQRGLFLAAGVVAALLPMIHTHGLIFLGLSFPALVLITARQLKPPRQRKQRFRDFIPWLYFLAPIALVALPQFLWLTSGVDTTKFFRPQYGWTNHNDLIIWFWLKNLGAFMPLLVVALIGKRKHPRPAWYSFAFAAASVFLIANLFVFQPWDWDNTKLFVYWVVASLPAVAAALVWLWRWHLAGRVVATVLFLSMLLAGSLDVGKTLAWQHSKARLFDTHAQTIASVVGHESAPEAIFLTAQQPDNPISGLAGRRIILGYTGWLWSYGIPYQDREEDVVRMYQATAETPQLLEKYGIDYVVFGPAERGDKGYRANEAYYAEHYRVWQQIGEGANRVTIYDIGQPVPRIPASTVSE